MATCFWGLSSLFAHELGYVPRPGRQTLCDTVNWLRAHPAPPGKHVHGGHAAPARTTRSQRRERLPIDPRASV